MPRMHVWFAGALAVCGVSYVSYWYLYLPHITAQAGFDEKMEVDQQHLQGVLQRLTKLRAAVEQARIKKSIGSRTAYDSTDSSSVWLTNREKLHFFCELQQVRCLFFSLPYLVKGFILATRAEASSLLQTLNVLEAQHCDFLNFREESLSFHQQMKCLLCFWIYVIGFKWIPALCWREDTPRRRRFFHTLAKQITSTLEIETTMSMDTDGDTEEARKLLKARAEDEYFLSKTKNMERLPLSTQYVVFNATHWIEEVGFWACANNPLLCQNPPSRLEILSTGPGGAGHANLSLLSRYSFFSAIWERLTLSRPCTAAFPLTFDAHWRACWQRREKDHANREVFFHPGSQSLRPISDVIPNGHDSTAPILEGEEGDLRHSKGESTAACGWRSPRASFGYPLCSDPAALASFLQNTQSRPSRASSSQHNAKKGGESETCREKGAGGAFSRKDEAVFPPPWIPVVVGGLPRLLFVDTSLARPDVRPPATRAGVYHHLAQTQFPEPVPLQRSKADLQRTLEEKAGSNGPLCSANGSEAKKGPLDGVRGGLVGGWPCFSKVWWGGVYGGRQGSRRRGLHYHVGYPTPTEELPSELIRCAKNAITSVYAE